MNGNLRDTGSTDANRPRLATWRTIAHGSRGRALLWAIVVIAAVAALFVVRAIDPADPADAHFYPFCVFHELTGLDCPGCGTLRGPSIAARESCRRIADERALGLPSADCSCRRRPQRDRGLARNSGRVAAPALGAGRLALGGCDSDRRVWYPTKRPGVAVYPFGAALIVAGTLRVPSAARRTNPSTFSLLVAAHGVCLLHYAQAANVARSSESRT